MQVLGARGQGAEVGQPDSEDSGSLMGVVWGVGAGDRPLRLYDDSSELRHAVY